MNCFYHAEAPNVAFCIHCGRALCNECIRNVKGSVYCEPCLGDYVEGKASASSSSSTSSTSTASSTAGGSSIPNGATVKKEIGGANPGAAFALGLIPGVGAIYNGEFVKAAVHILIFGTIVSLHDATDAAIFGLAAAAFYFYMPFEAYYTAKKRLLGSQGIMLETPIDRMQQQFGNIKDRELWGGITLMVIGGLYLLGNLDVFDMHRIARLWPLVFVLIGVWLLRNHQERPK
jgi:TM2 domain-containing membrane protein YozV